VKRDKATHIAPSGSERTHSDAVRVSRTNINGPQQAADNYQAPKVNQNLNGYSTSCNENKTFLLPGKSPDFLALSDTTR
jgi:hypothetical protein